MLVPFFKISRPRFWPYLFGPFIIGLTSANNYSNWWLLVISGLYFSLPANLLIYGVNDIFDYETDKVNPKKQSYETLLKPAQQKSLLKLILLFNFPILVLMLFMPMAAVLSLLAFWFFGVFYSSPPIRAKTKPFLDSFFNILYIFPALVSYGLITGEFPSLVIIISATLWCMAMHAYSAVPDIESDRKANMATIATVLGSKLTLIFCLGAYVGSAILTYQWLGVFSVFAGLVYGTMVIMSLFRQTKIFHLYKIFPYINLGLGAGLFFWIELVVK